jgi:poly(A) polymerase
MTERLPPQPWMTDPRTTAVLDALEAAGGPDCARFVGGAVRNTLLGAPIDDVDIATRLTPDESIRALAAAKLRCVPTGVEHGTVTAISGGRPFEITTLRRDVETDGRRAVVAFSTDWAEDAARRDFRLNALYADREGVIYDPVGGGVADAREGHIVFVGEAQTRIREDYLRILRFFRFFAWYGRGEPDRAGLAACVALKDGVATLSAERVSKELLKLLAAPQPQASVHLMAETGVLEIVLGGAFNQLRFEAMTAIDPDPELRLSALLIDEPAQVAALAERLRLSAAQRERLLDALPPADLAMDERTARAAIYRHGAGVFADRIKRAWAAAPDQESQARRLLALAAGWTPPRFPLGGGDVMALGVAKGPQIGRLLRAVEDWWVAQDFPTAGVRERLADEARSEGGA